MTQIPEGANTRSEPTPGLPGAGLPGAGLLTPHFSLAEMVASQTATRMGLNNTPPPEAIEALRTLCKYILEPLRAALGPVLISSGYRSLLVNRAIGGSISSQHRKGQAADLSVRGVALDEVAVWIYRNAPYDQLIREFPPGGWVHVSYAGLGRRSALVARRLENGGTDYSTWEPGDAGDGPDLRTVYVSPDGRVHQAGGGAMNALLVFNDWRSGEGSIYQTELGVRLSTGDLHSGTCWRVTIEGLPADVEQELRDAYTQHRAEAVFRLVPT